jgi:hypothetical protein
VVFTLPQAINGWTEIHPEVIYDQPLKSAWETLKAFAADPRRLDGQLGATLVLHTWGQTLTRHLHVHALVPGGALTEQGTRNAARSTYLFPVRALSRYCHGHFVRCLRERHERGELPRVQDAQALKRLLDTLMGQDWEAIGQAESEPQAKQSEPDEGQPDAYRCPRCQQGRLQVVAILTPRGTFIRWPGSPRAPNRAH